jgi:hypothetical protein
MATVNDEDREFANKVAALQYVPCRSDIAGLHAETRERIEANVHASWTSCTNTLRDIITKRDKHIAEIEAQHRYERVDCEEWRNWARLLTGFAEGSTDGGMRSIVDSKIAELESKLAATEAALDRAHDKLIELAAAKPVLTAAERHDLDNVLSTHLKGGVAHNTALVLQRICTPPKAPPTDAELLATLQAGLDADDNEALSDAADKVRDALRARSGK